MPNKEPLNFILLHQKCDSSLQFAIDLWIPWTDCVIGKPKSDTHYTAWYAMPDKIGKYGF